MIEQAGMGLGLGEGGVVAAFAADQRAAGAAAAGGEQVAVTFAVEVGRAGQAADQAVGAVAAVELVGAGTGLEQVVLGAGPDRVVAEAAGDADVAERDQRAVGANPSLPGPRSTSPAGRAGERAVDPLRVVPGVVQPGPMARPLAALMPKVSVASSKATVKSSGPAPPTICSPPPPPLVRRAGRKPWLSAWLPCRRKRRGRAEAGVASLAADQFVGTAAAAQVVVARPTVDPVLPLVPSAVAEGRAFEVLEAEEPIVAVAAGFVSRAARPRRRSPCRPRPRSRRRRCRRCRPAVHAVVAVVAVDEVVVAGPTVDGVDAEAAGDLVVVAGPAGGPCRRRGRRSPGRSPASP